jgi:hypothetical protein
MTIQYHIGFIQNLLNQGLASDSSRYTNRHIYEALRVARQVLLKRKYDQYQYTSFQNEQAISGMRLALAPIDAFSCPECPKKEYPRTLCQIPSIIDTNRRVLITQVRLANGTILPQRRLQDIDTIQYSKFRKPNTPFYFMHNNYIYVANLDELQVLHMSAVFSDPMDLARVNCLTQEEDACTNFLELEFPIDGYLVRDMYNLAIEQLAQSMRFAIEDKSANAADNTTQTDGTV